MVHLKIQNRDRYYKTERGCFKWVRYGQKALSVLKKSFSGVRYTIFKIVTKNGLQNPEKQPSSIPSNISNRNTY